MSSYLDHRNNGGVITHSWAEHTRLNLLQHYHPDQVARIMAGNDHKTQVDLARWRNLGRRDAA